MIQIAKRKPHSWNSIDNDFRKIFVTFTTLSNSSKDEGHSKYKFSCAIYFR